MALETQSVIPSHNGSEKPQIESSCHHVCRGERALSSQQFLSQKCCSYRFTPFRDVSVWVTGSSNLLRNGARDQSLQKKKKSLKTDCKPALVHPLPPSVRLYLSLQSRIALPYNQRGNEKVGLAISSSVRSKAYHTAPLLTLRLTSQVLSKSWIRDISTTKYL